VFLLYLNSQNAIIKWKELSTGTVNASLLSPRELFLDALKNDAVSLILLHNHPSGNPSPSDKDIVITERIRKLGEELGIKLLDHIIIGDKKYYSFSEEGLI
jgi:DNA repair protein RadC